MKLLVSILFLPMCVTVLALHTPRGFETFGGVQMVRTATAVPVATKPFMFIVSGIGDGRFGISTNGVEFWDDYWDTEVYGSTMVGYDLRGDGQMFFASTNKLTIARQ